MQTRSSFLVRGSFAAALVLASTPAFAQLDPLLFLKTTRPNVILAVDTANRMQHDADDVYYDPGTYPRANASWEQELGLASSDASTSYRRKYYDLGHMNVSETGTAKFQTSRIEAVGSLAGGYSTFYERTRLAIARRALIRAINDNLTSARFALVKTRQSSPTLLPAGNDSPVWSTTQISDTEISNSRWKITRTTVGGSNSTQTTTGLVWGATDAPSIIATTLGRDLGTAGALLPAGTDSASQLDAPVGLLIDDARAHAATLIAADAAANGCRNTIIVLVVGGAEGTINAQQLQSKAFPLISGRRVPVYVIALAPPATDVPALQAVAFNSGGQYFEITKAMIESVAAGQPVPGVVRAVNRAVQHAFAEFTDFNTAGGVTEHQTTSPIVGSVNLKGASKINANGSPEVLPDSETDLVNTITGSQIPQRSNVMVTSGFSLPGFDGQLRGFRVYKPVPDPTRPSGYRFDQDGSRLWVASTPTARPRNIYTVLPNGQMVAFTATNAAQLSTYLRVTDPEPLIEWVRAQPLGAVIGSTPAFLDPPSVDPPPDTAYPAFIEDLKDRRSLVFVGANDGMLHALDSRTGVEVWAFIPFNLLPKLTALRSGQSFDEFKYFVDSSPKLADVRVGNNWRTYLFFGQGPGGTFYNALDVTLDEMADSISPTMNNEGALLDFFADADRIPWLWAFPRLTSFDHTISTSATPYGDLAATASPDEKRVGETWSDPAIGQALNPSGPWVMLVGSGFLKRSIELQANRADVLRAGTTFYALDVPSGLVHASRDVGSDGLAETVDSCRAVNDCTRIKNALQMDPVATGPADSRFITSAYIGDLDGRVWRFDLTVSSEEARLATPVRLYEAGASYPLFASMATVNVGGTKQYLFIGTGSDLLPSNGVNQSYSMLVLLDNGASATKTAEILLDRTDGVGADEKVTSFPAVAGDIVFFSTTSYRPTTSCTPYDANLYAFTFIGGPAYDTNGDGILSTGITTGKGSKTTTAPADSTKIFTAAGVRATAPFVVDQHLVFTTGSQIQLFGDPEDFNNGVGQAGVRILSWRMVK